MRIISGAYAGRFLRTPQDYTIRPTTDRVRENLFNILQHQDSGFFKGKVVVDLFAGTGSLGLEALSRGASYVVFVEKDKKALHLLWQNITALCVAPQVRVLAKDATCARSFIPLLSVQNPSPRQSLGREQSIGHSTPMLLQIPEKFDIVFADPPYRYGLGEKAFLALSESCLLKKDAWLILEEDKASMVSMPACFTLSREKVYGRTSVRFYRFLGPQKEIYSL